MKKHILQVLLLLLASVATAQETGTYLPANFLCDSIEVSTIDSNAALNAFSLVDSIYKKLPADSIGTGLLMDKSLGIIDCTKYKGDSTLDDTCHYASLLQLHSSVYWAYLDTTERPIYVAQYDSIAQLYRDSGYVPIGLILAPYNRVKDNAVEDTLLILNGIQVEQNVPWRGHPFEEGNVYAAAALSFFTDTGAVKFILPTALIYNSTGETIQSLEADFDDGNGFVPLGADGVVPIDYVSESGKKIILIRVFLPGGRVKLLKFEFGSKIKKDIGDGHNHML